MGKTARLRQMVGKQSTYDAIIRVYKDLLREGDKKKLYLFKAEVYGCLNPLNTSTAWRNVDDFFGEREIHLTVKWLFESGMNKCFGNERSECIKRTI